MPLKTSSLLRQQQSLAAEHKGEKWKNKRKREVRGLFTGGVKGRTQVPVDLHRGSMLKERN